MSFKLAAVLKGHNGAVTSLAIAHKEEGDRLVSGSRDKTLLVWDLPRATDVYAEPKRSLHGHSHFVEDIALSADGNFALSGSWDGTLRLWDLKSGVSTRRFVGHSKDVLSVAFSSDNRQIISGARDCKINIWNTLAELKYTAQEQNHTEWVSCVRCSPQTDGEPFFASAGWDGQVKLWSLKNFKHIATLSGHKDYLSSIAFSPDGTLLASAGRDGSVKIWNVAEKKETLSLEAGCVIHMVAFCPGKPLIAAATDKGIKIWNLQTHKVVDQLYKKGEEFDTELRNPVPLSIAWSTDGSALFSGYTDNKIRVWETL